MSLVTPRRGAALPHTPRMSERKRALFQPSTPAPNTYSATPSSFGDSDLGIMSQIHCDSSDDDYSLTPDSWKRSGSKVEESNQRGNRLNASLPAPKARQSLFGTSEQNKQGISPKSFYPKSDSKHSTSLPLESSKTTSNPKPAVKLRSFRNKRQAYRKNRKRRLGEINMGVHHAIKKPKPKISSVTKVDALKLALNIIENSPLNDYIAEFMSVKTNKVVIHNIDKNKENLKNDQTIDMSIDQIDKADSILKELGCTESLAILAEKPSKRNDIRDKSIDFNKSIDLMQSLNINKTIDLNKSLDIYKTNKTAVDNQFSVPERIPFIKLDPNEMSNNHLELDASDLLADDEENFSLPEITSIDAMLKQWTEDEVPVNEPQITTHKQENNSDKPILIQLSPVSLNEKKILPNMKSPDNGRKRKVYSIFDKEAVRAKQQKMDEIRKDKNSPVVRRLLCDDKQQYIIDAGQKNFGATQCPECGVIYQVGDAQDEADHMTHHLALDVLKFNGWKREKVCCQWNGGRILVVKSGDPPSHWQRVNTLLERVVHPQLGYSASLSRHKDYKVYLYVEGRQLIGCLVAERVHEAFEMLPGYNVDCISVESYPVKCGISRIWTHVSHRKKGVASRLVDTLRADFIFGNLLLSNQIAFSSPTPLGKLFAEKYTHRKNFYVYEE